MPRREGAAGRDQAIARPAPIRRVLGGPVGGAGSGASLPLLVFGDVPDPDPAKIRLRHSAAQHIVSFRRTTCFHQTVVMSSSLGLRSLAILCGLVPPWMPAAGQAPPGILTCPNCRIVLDTVMTIGGANGQAVHLISRGSSFAMDDRGRFLVAGFGSEEFAVFDTTGALLRTVGRRGQGPGEYEFIQNLAAGHGFIHVIEASSDRTLLNLDFEFVRSDPTQARSVLSSVALPGGDVIFMSDARLPQSVGHPLHVLRRDGSVRSFGGGGELVRGNLTSGLVGGDGEDEVWLIGTTSNIVSRWNLSAPDAPTVVFHRESPWFDAARSSDPHIWPSTVFRAARAGRPGLWLTATLPDEDFTPRRVAGPPPDLPTQETRDSWLELMDRETGLTIVRARFDELVLGFPSPDHVVMLREDARGVPFLSLLRLRVQGLPSTQLPSF